MTFLQQGGASSLKFVMLVLFLILSPRVREEDGEEKLALIAVEAMPTGSKLPAVVIVRIYPGEKHDFSASAPLSTRASFLHIIGRAGGSSYLLLQS